MKKLSNVPSFLASLGLAILLLSGCGVLGYVITFLVWLVGPHMALPAGTAGTFLKWSNILFFGGLGIGIVLLAIGFIGEILLDKYRPNNENTYEPYDSDSITEEN